VKDHLRTRGVEFDAVNLQADASAVEELRARQMQSLPVLAVGDRFLATPHADEIDALFGFDPAPAFVLSEDDLIERAQALLAAAVRFGRQLPPERYDDPTPGMENADALLLPDGTRVLLPDGRPYIPHATSLGLLRHILGHGAKFLLLAVDPGNERFARAELFAPYGEPDDRLGLAEIERIADEIGLAIRDCRPNLAYPVETFMGTKTVHEMLQAMTYSLAQHTRQLESILVSLGIEPDGGLTESAYRGLGMPDAIWS
jgi:hypothetical protein